MVSWSKWELHPDLREALDTGQTFEEWLGGDRRPGASYARISKDLRKEMGVKRQHLNNDEFAAKNGVVIVVRYTDNDITAVNPDVERPAFLRFIRDLRARRCEEGYPIHGVISVEEYRLVRLPEDYLRLHRALTVDDDGFYGLVDAGSFLDVHSDAAMLRGLLTSTMGEIEVKGIRRRVSRNSRDKALEGAPAGRGRFGWLPADAATGRNANELLNPVEAPIVMNAIDLRLKNKSWRSILFESMKEIIRVVEELERAAAEQGTISQQAERLRQKAKSASDETIMYMVTNPANCGYRVINHELVRDRETGKPVVGKWETLCEVEEWEKLVADSPKFFGLKEKPEKQARRGRSKGEFADEARKHQSSGVLRCGRENELGETCYGKMTGSEGKRQAIYKCSSPACGRLGRQMKGVDLTIEQLALKVLLKNYASKEPEQKEWYGQKTLDKLLKEKAKLKARFKAGQVEGDDFFELLEDLNEKIRDSQADKAAFDKEQASENFLSRFSEKKWKSWDVRQKRVAIDAVLSAVIVLPIPEGRSTRAPFDPTLLVPVWRKPVKNEPKEGSNETKGLRAIVGVSDELRGEQAVLVPVVVEHAAELRRILRTPEVRARWGEEEPSPEWPFDDPSATCFSVMVDGAVRGLVQYGEEDDPMYRHASIDIFLDPAVHGRGVGRDAVRAMARHLVRDLGHHRLVIDPAADNEAAIRCYSAVGFKPVGILRRYERDADGVGWHDGLLMDLLAEELSP